MTLMQHPTEQIITDQSQVVPIALSASLRGQGLGTRNEGPFACRAKAPPAKRSEKGYGDENGLTPLQDMEGILFLPSDV